MVFLLLAQKTIIQTNWEQARTIVQTVQSVFATLQSIVTISAVIIGVFAYFLSRKPFPKVTQKHSVIHEFLDQNILWIRVNVEIKNEGLVRLSLQKLEAHIQIITPLLDPTREKIQEFKTDQYQYPDVDWLSINGKDIDLEQRIISKKLEPGEIDYVFSDFILEDDQNLPYSKVSMILITTNLTLKSNPLSRLTRWITGDKRVYKMSTPYKIPPNSMKSSLIL